LAVKDIFPDLLFPVNHPQSLIEGSNPYFDFGFVDPRKKNRSRLDIRWVSALEPATNMKVHVLIVHQLQNL
jgi:hypothetical protein